MTRWENILLEISLFIFLGFLYYFYQKKKIIKYESNKISTVMQFILEACLKDKKDEPQPELDSLILSIDDYINKQTEHPPLPQLKHYMNSPNCTVELREIIDEGLKEIEGKI